MSVRKTIGLTLVFTLFLAVSAHGTDYPSRFITFQVPWPAGGSSDMGARILAGIAEKKLGQSIVVINRVGAGSQVGLTELARAKPDGYYLGLVNFPAMNTIVLDPERKATFQVDSFTPIISQVVDPCFIFVRADSPYKTLKDLLDDAKKRPGVIRTSTTGILSDAHLGILMMEEAAGVKFRLVHFDGGAQQMTATLGGQVDVTFDHVGGLPPRIQAGAVRGLALLDRTRTKFLPDIPTTVELGYSTVITASTRGVMGPKGIPDPIVKKLQEVFLEAMKSPEHVEKMEKAGLAVRPMFGEEYARYFREAHERYRLLIQAAQKAR